VVTIRKAELRDVPALFRMISHYAAERVMLPRPLVELYENIWEFTVAEEDGEILGCGALKFYSAELAEIRSLSVAPGIKKHGLGRALSEEILSEAERYGLKTVFALTVVPDFFEKLGFREVSREVFPSKVWRDCLECPKYSYCDEKALVLELASRRTYATESRLEPARISV
jgi:amino-acid N-acetyltransferase